MMHTTIPASKVFETITAEVSETGVWFAVNGQDGRVGLSLAEAERFAADLQAAIAFYALRRKQELEDSL